MRSSSSPFHFQDLLLPLRPLNIWLRPLLRLPLPYVLPSSFPWITCFRRQFLRKIVTNSVILPSSYYVYDIPLLLDCKCKCFRRQNCDQSSYSSFCVLYVLHVCRIFVTSLTISVLEGSSYAKLWPIQLSFLLLIICTIFLSSLTMSNTS